MKYFVFITLQIISSGFNHHAEVLPVEICPGSLVSAAQGKTKLLVEVSQNQIMRFTHYTLRKGFNTSVQFFMFLNKCSYVRG